MRYHQEMWRKVRPTQAPQGDERDLSLLHISELSRKQLARHLHDGPIQAVSALALRANLASRQLTSNPPAAADEVRNLEELSRQTARDLRYLQFTLVPLSLGDGLDVALQDLVRLHAELFGQVIELAVDNQAPRALDKSQEKSLFHIAAQALDNTRRHAQAGRVQLKLTQPEAGVVLLEVEDDGLGFDPDIAERSGTRGDKFGLVIIREHAKLLNAELHVHSSPGAGAMLRLALPTGRRL